MLITLRGLKQILSRHYANLRWYSLHYFFDSMEHLPIHLPFEAKGGGPVQYRWMYPFERLDIRVAMYFIYKSIFFVFLNWKYLINSMQVLIQSQEKKLRTRRMLRLRYVRPILLRRSQHLSRTISNLIWEWESISFHGMIMAVKCLLVGTCQYFPILDDPHLKMS